MALHFDGTPNEQPIPPDPDVLKHFGIDAVVSSLGGRFNKHWIVERREQRFVLRQWGGTRNDAAYESRLLAEVAKRGWPLAVPIDYIENDHVWSLNPLLEGTPASDKNSAREQRTRGRLLAEFHASTEGIDLGPRPPWRRAEVILADTSIDTLLARFEGERPEEILIVRQHLEAARRMMESQGLVQRPSILIHGDFTQWNLLFTGDRLTGLLDFEMARPDHRVAEFAYSWRGLYDDVIHGYCEVTPLEPEELALIVPIWWATLIGGVDQVLRRDGGNIDWFVTKLQTRSPLMETGVI